MSMAQLNRILSKRPNWSLLRVLLEGRIRAEGADCGRWMIVSIDGDAVGIYEGQHNIHFCS